MVTLLASSSPSWYVRSRKNVRRTTENVSQLLSYVYSDGVWKGCLSCVCRAVSERRARRAELVSEINA